MKKVVAGNWKMNHGPRATRDYLERFRPPTGPGAPRICLFPPTVSLAPAVEAAAPINVQPFVQGGKMIAVSNSTFIQFPPS